MTEKEKEVLELVKKSSDPDAAIRVALALLASLLAEQETSPVPREKVS